MWTGAPALVDWCEPNYLVTPWVAEWWNTLSSVGMVGIAAVGLRLLPAAATARLGVALLAVIGLGSAAFHGTLLRVAQAADELPMVAMGMACVWALATRGRPDRAGPLAGALALFGAAFAVAYAWVPWAFGLFVAVYGGMVAWVLIRTIQLTRAGPPSLRGPAALTLGAYVGSFVFFWLPEHVFLPCDHPLQVLPLHAFWHLGGGVGTAAWWAWMARAAESAPGPELAAARDG